MYVVNENTPGYLPEDDDPAVFCRRCSITSRRVKSLTRANLQASRFTVRFRMICPCSCMTTRASTILAGSSRFSRLKR